MSNRRGFTIVELLVVTTIIVVLLALLAPAMNRAIYQAELLMCSTRLNAFYMGLHWYTEDFRRRYPHRHQGFSGHEINMIVKAIPGQSPRDMRSIVKGYIQVNRMWQCPLSREIDMESRDDSHTWSNYVFWFGEKYDIASRGMYKRNDQWEFNDRKYDIIIGDWDRIFGRDSKARGAHYDHATEQMISEVYQNTVPVLPFVQPITISSWVLYGTERRGPLDTNYAFADGSVRRYHDVHWDDSRMDHVGMWWGSNETDILGDWTHVPRQ